MGIRSKIADWIDEHRTQDSGGDLLTLLFKKDNMTREKAMEIPGFAGCVRFITQTAASLPVRLYRDTGGEVEEVLGDIRTHLLNNDTGDVLNGWQFKQALAADLLIEGGGYAYIEKSRNEVESLHYIDPAHISFLPGTDPIYKRCGIAVNGREYRDFEFIKATRSTKDGVRGTGILEENMLPLAVAYNTFKYENALVKRGGNSKGFLKSEKKLTDDALKELRERWEKYNKTDEDGTGVMVLNAGLDFKETSATPEQLQISQRKKDLAADICGIFGVSPAVVNGNPSDDEYTAAIKIAVLPVLESIEAALNHDLLLEAEKGELYFSFDTKELLRGSIEKRYAAYKDGIESNVLQIDEARYMENLPPLDLTFIKLGLQDVLYDPKTETFFVPNTGMSGKMADTTTPSKWDKGQLGEERSNDYIQDEETGLMNGSRPSGDGDTGIGSSGAETDVCTIADFGTPYHEYSGKPDEAIEHLLAIQEGHVPKAIHKDGVGDIDIVWGEAGTGRKGYGLSHIIRRRNEKGQDGIKLVRELPEIIKNGEVISEYEDRKYIVTKDHKAIVRLDYDGVQAKWLASAFIKD